MFSYVRNVVDIIRVSCIAKVSFVIDFSERRFNSIMENHLFDTVLNFVYARALLMSPFFVLCFRMSET